MLGCHRVDTFGMERRTPGRAGRTHRAPRFLGHIVIGVGLAYLAATAGVGMTQGSTAPVSATVRSIDQSSPAPTPSAPLDAGVPSSGTDGAVQQELVVEVSSGGALRVTPDHLTVTLHRDASDPDQLVGVLGPVVLVDPRGTLAGWHVRAVATGPCGSRLLVHPGQPVAVAGRQSEVHRGDAQPTAHHDDVQSESHQDGVLLMWAPRGGGGGTFTVGATVIVHHARPDHGQFVTFSIRAS